MMKIREIFIYLHRFFFLGYDITVVRWAALRRYVITNPPFSTERGRPYFRNLLLVAPVPRWSIGLQDVRCRASVESGVVHTSRRVPFVKKKGSTILVLAYMSEVVGNPEALRSPEPPLSEKRDKDVGMTGEAIFKEL